MASNKKILIADDDQGILDSVSLLLEEVGYEVKTTSDGSTISDFSHFTPDLLLLDIWMAGWNGSDICKELKADTNTKQIPIIIVSANKDGAVIAKDAGADDFIAKPFELDELISKVEKHVQ